MHQIKGLTHPKDAPVFIGPIAQIAMDGNRRHVVFQNVTGRDPAAFDLQVGNCLDEQRPVTFSPVLGKHLQMTDRPLFPYSDISDLLAVHIAVEHVLLFRRNKGE